MTVNGLSINFVTAQDLPFVFEFMQDHFRVQEPITSALGCSAEDSFDFYSDITKGAVKMPFCSLIARDSAGQVVGLSLNTVYEYDELSTKTFDADKKEYADLIEAGPYGSRNANRLAVFIDVVEAGLYKNVSPWSRIFKVDILAVRADQAKKGLGSFFVKSALDLARRHQCSHAATCATAQASQRLFTRSGFQTVREFEFADFQDQGVPVFAGVHDRGPSAKLMILPLA